MLSFELIIFHTCIYTCLKKAYISVNITVLGLKQTNELKEEPDRCTGNYAGAPFVLPHT